MSKTSRYSRTLMSTSALVGTLFSTSVLALGNTAIVATSGGDYTDPQAAMADLATWCGTPSATNPCTLKLSAGVFDTGTSALVMQDYVSLVGVSQDATTLTSSSAGGTLAGANNMTISNLTVDTGTDPSTFVTGINNNSKSPNMRNITVKVRASGYHTSYGIQNVNSTALMENITVTQTSNSWNTGIYNQKGATVIRNSSIDVTGTGFNAGIENVGGNSLHKIYDSQIKATGGSTNEGIRINTTKLWAYNLHIDVSGGSSATGIHQTSNQSQNWHRINHSVIEAYGATSGYAVKMPGGYNGISLNNNYLRGVNGSVYAASPFTLHVHQTRLHTTPGIVKSGSPTLFCTAVTEGNTTFHPTGCP